MTQSLYRKCIISEITRIIVSVIVQGMKPIYREKIEQKAHENQFKLVGTTFKYTMKENVCQKC